MSHRPFRVFLLLFCVIVLAQESAVGSLMFGVECADGCPDDPGPGRCAPSCTACACVAHGTALPTQPSATAAGPEIAGTMRAHGDSPTADAPPARVFHVPRPSVV